MSTIAYLRFSTSRQDERQQLNTIQKYLAYKGMNLDKTYTDEGISGGTSYTRRNLFDLCREIRPHDIVIISEISRLTRSGIGELTEIIEKHFKPNKLRLIICNVNLDIDCSDINPFIEMQLAFMATMAKIEKQLIIDRVRSAHEVRKRQIAEQGYFINKRGEKVTSYSEAYGKRTGTTHAQALEQARQQRSVNMRKKAMENPNNVQFKKYLDMYEQRNGYIGANSDITPFTEELNKLGYKTATGMEFNNTRARAMLYKIRELYID